MPSTAPADTTAPDRRVALFLQGPPSGFWPQLAGALEARGARTLRVNLCLADRLFWRRPGALDYRGRLAGWRRWLTALMRREGVTDVLYFADRLPYHRIACAAARTLGARAWAVEFGYLRPDWLTLEPEAGGAFSLFPSDPAELRRDLPAPDMRPRHAHPFWREAAAEVSFNLLMTAGRPLYPFYADDKWQPPVVDYLAWLPKLALSRRTATRAARVQARLLEGGRPFMLLALQMQSDYQLRRSSPYRRQRLMIEEVVADFAAHAPADMALLVKQHPLDNGLERWGRIAAAAARRAGVAERVETIDGGDLGALIAACRGVIVCNSTVGLHALRARKPVKALGAAVYDMPGLTDPQPLSGFWRAPRPPDPALVSAITAELAARIQVKGSFYMPEGRRLAAAEMAERLLAAGPAPGRADRAARAARLRALAQRRREVDAGAAAG